MTLESGTRIGSFEVGERLGAGGMGEVWRARDTRLGREVAIKALTAAFAQDAERLARFEREAKLLASLRDLLARCLTKDVRRRLRDVGEARIVLEDALAVMSGGSVSGAAAGAPAAGVSAAPPAREGRGPGRVRALVPWIVAAIAVATAIGLGTRSRGAPDGPVTLSVMIPPGYELDASPEYNILALAPDGRALAYTARRDGTTRASLARADFRSQISAQGGNMPQWSPGGEEIYFTSNDALYAAAVHPSGQGLLSDPPRRLMTLPSISGDSSVRDYDVNPKTGRILVRMQAANAAERRGIVVTLGWAGTLDRAPGAL